MGKKWIALAGAGVGLAAIAGAAIHSYLDVMYKETIPRGPLARTRDLLDDGMMDALHELTAENNEVNDTLNPEVIDLKNSRDEVLKGYLYEADEPSDTYVVFAHGYRGDHRGDPANFLKFYRDKGYNFFAVDHTAAGESGGSYVGFDYYEANDTLEWIDYLVDRFGEDIKIILQGVSMGGATVCKMASRVPKQVKFIIADCPFTSAEDEMLAVAGGFLKIDKAAPIMFKAINELNKKLAGYDLLDTDVRDSVICSKAPMLFVHGGSDTFVPTSMGKELYELCGNEKDMLIVPIARHADSIVWDPEGYHEKVDEFIEKYL